MKVQLVVVRGKPEGKVIPLVGPRFKIGRGETCHLRPNSEQVSREHAEFAIIGDTINVRDLGSRNGTLVNGKALTTEPCQLKDRDLVQVGPLTFAVSILDATPSSGKTPIPSGPASKASLDDVSNDDIDSWLVGPSTSSSPEVPTTVYGGDTLTISAFKDAGTPPKPATPSSASDDEYERQPDDEQEELDEPFDEEENEEDEAIDEGATVAENPDEFMDESNPFFAAKKAQQMQAKQAAAGPSKANFKDTSDAAGDILRRLMERRRAEKS
jgi:pSer/pThr/pTyr-binding forkhead associated (FHA) protein